MEKFEDKITKLNETETFQSAMTYEQDQKLILNTEKRISYDEGEKNKQTEIAKSMLKEKLPLEIIIKCTGLLESEINLLK